MPDSSKVALLLVTDELIRKGLELLLRDMGITVISAGSISELDHRLSLITAPPNLLLFQLITSDNSPAIYLVRKLRKRFNHCTPTILLDNESAMHELLFTDKYLKILPDQIKPAVLREKIIESITCPDKEIHLN